MIQRAPWVLIVVLFGLLLIERCGSDSNAALERAETAEAAIVVLAAQRDSARARSDSVARVVALQAEAYKADSLAWVEDRARADQRIREATRRASLVATDLTARLDSVETALFADYQAEVDSVLAAKDETIAGLEARVLAVTEQRETLGVLVDGLRLELDAERAINAQRLEVNEALRDALRSRVRRQWGERLVAVAAIGLAIIR